MSKHVTHVTQHCSILNYIRLTDQQLYTLIEELCLGRIFVPRKGSGGVTFLQPDEKLVSQFLKMEADGYGDKVVEHIRALVLQGCLDNVKDFDDSNGQVVTSSKKVLPVSKVEHGTVYLEGGQKITPDTKFKRRTDRTNLAIYNITGKPLDVDSLKQADPNTRPRVRVEGGAEYGSNKAALFEQVLSAYFTVNKSERDPALEVLVSLMIYLTKNNKHDVLATVKSLLSTDTLTTLAIVLQPYKNALDENTTYISSELYTNWKTEYSVGETQLFSYIAAPVAYYNKMMTEAASTYGQVIVALRAAQEANLGDADKTNILNQITSYYTAVANQAQLPAKRLAVARNHAEAIAEAELRVLGFIMLDDHSPSLDTATTLYKNNCTLNKPYLCGNPGIVNIMQAGVFYSTAYLMLRSEAIFHLPGYSDGWPAIGPNITGSGMLSIDASTQLSTDMDRFYTTEIKRITVNIDLFKP